VQNDLLYVVFCRLQTEKKFTGADAVAEALCGFVPDGGVVHRLPLSEFIVSII
jgi:hypothetical protein